MASAPPPPSPMPAASRAPRAATTAARFADFDKVRRRKFTPLERGG
jgi:hypothetical protein